MKNINKSFALLCMGFAAVACVEENFEDNTPKYDTTPGNEIVFSATAGIENGMPEPETKTVYGDQDTDENGKKWIEINWDGNKDMIQIVSPEAAGPEVGHYRVGSNTPSEGFSQTHQSASVTKLGDGALQWSESDDYTFYGVYPSFAYDSDNNHGATASLTKDGLFTGSMPIDQNYTLEGNATDGWVAKPDMRYAFMTASDTYKRAPAEGEDDKRKDAEKAINLEFKSMVTALQFDIQPNLINYTDQVTGTTVSDMEVISVSLLSGKVDPTQTGKSISGSFQYNIPEAEYSTIQGTRMVSLHFDDQSVKLHSKGKSLNVTFFILPEDFNAADKLQLQIIFKLGGTQASKIATINTSNQNKPITGGKKYIFSDVKLPELNNEVTSSSWWDTLDPDTILPQISIPVAANVFASNYYGTSERKNQQQTLTIEQLWAMGVRGFEICNQSAAKGGSTAQYNGGETSTLYNAGDANNYNTAAGRNLGPCRVVAAESFVGQGQNMTFHKAFHSLCGLLKQPSAQNECLIIVCTYMSVDDGYCPYSYVANLVNYLDWYCNTFEDRYVNSDDFRVIDSQTTVGDLRGKISIIVRPGDDERWLGETDALTNPSSILGSLDGSLTAKIPDALNTNMNTKWTTWKDKLMFISDWGSAAFDVWDRRYGSKYARAARFNQQAIEKGVSGVSAKPYIENYLFGISSANGQELGNPSATYTYNSATGLNNFNNYGKDPATMPSFAEFNFEHQMSNGNTAYVQEWARVVEKDLRIPVAEKTNEGSYTLWVNWPSSLGEKKTAIKSLFENSIHTRNTTSTDLYINVLSGYFVDWNVSPQGTYPHKDPMDGFTKNERVLIWERNNGNVTGHGKGGDYYKLASQLNDYVYNLLSAEPGTANGLSEEGPWGLVMMDHINQTDISAHLVNLIMMNNFKFPLSVKPENGVSASVKDYNSVYMDGQNAISFE